DVMVRRRRDEAHAGRGVTCSGHPRVYLRGWQLAALAGLRALREFDLDVIRLGEIQARDAEATGGDLLDGAAAFRIEQAVDVFAALPRVRLAADAVHGDRERLVSLARDRAVAHRTGRETLDDGADRLHRVDRDSRSRACTQREQATNRLQLGCLLVHELRVLAEDVVATVARGVLQAEHGLRIEQV